MFKGHWFPPKAVIGQLIIILALTAHFHFREKPSLLLLNSLCVLQLVLTGLCCSALEKL